MKNLNLSSSSLVSIYVVFLSVVFPLNANERPLSKSSPPIPISSPRESSTHKRRVPFSVPPIHEHTEALLNYIISKQVDKKRRSFIPIPTNPSSRTSPEVKEKLEKNGFKVYDL